MQPHSCFCTIILISKHTFYLAVNRGQSQRDSTIFFLESALRWKRCDTLVAHGTLPVGKDGREKKAEAVVAFLENLHQ